MKNRMNSAVLALGITAAASTGCDLLKGNQPIPPVEASDAVPTSEAAPEQTAAPQTQATAAPETKPAPAPTSTVKGYSPVAVSPRWEMHESASNYLCDRLEPAIGTGIVLIEDGSFWIADCANKQIIKILNNCDANYSDNVTNVEDATCARDKRGFRTVDVTSFISEKDAGQRKVVMTGSDRNKGETMPLNAHWPTNESYEVATGEDAPMFGEDANIWILHEKEGKVARAHVNPTPKTVTPKVVPSVVPTQENSDLNRRVGALERRVDGVEVEVGKQGRRITAVELMIPKTTVNTKDAHSIAADAARK